MLLVEPLTGVRTVTAAGTPERINENTNKQNAYAISLWIHAHTANTGNLYIAKRGDLATATNGFILGPGETVLIDVSRFPDCYIDLNSIWIDAAVNGEGFSYLAVEVLH